MTLYTLTGDFYESYFYGALVVHVYPSGLIRTARRSASVDWETWHRACFARHHS